MFCADIFEVRLRMRKASQRSNESVRNTQPHMVENCATSLNCLSLFGVLWLQRHPNMNSGSTHRFGFNRNRSIHQPNTFAHADETQTLALQCSFDVEPFA